MKYQSLQSIQIQVTITEDGMEGSYDALQALTQAISQVLCLIIQASWKYVFNGLKEGVPDLLSLQKEKKKKTLSQLQDWKSIR